MDAALEAGAEDVETFDDGAIDVYTARKFWVMSKTRWMQPVSKLNLPKYR